MSERPGFTDECVEAPEAGIKERYQTAGSRRADSRGAAAARQRRLLQRCVEERGMKGDLMAGQLDVSGRKKGWTGREMEASKTERRRLSGW